MCLPLFVRKCEKIVFWSDINKLTKLNFFFKTTNRFNKNWICTFIWNRQKSAIALSAERQQNCTSLYRDERQRNPPDPGAAMDRGGARPFQQRQVCYDKDVILSCMCTYAVKLSAIWLPLLRRQIRAFFSLFQTKYYMYLGIQTVYTRMQFKFVILV